MPCRLELLKLHDQTLEAKLAQKREEAQEDASWSAQPDYVHTVDRSMPWTVPSQLLTAEEEVSTGWLGQLTFPGPSSLLQTRAWGDQGAGSEHRTALLGLAQYLCSCWRLTRRSNS